MTRLTSQLGVVFALGIGSLGTPVGAQDAPQESAEAIADNVPEGSVGGMGDINLYPRRVTIEGRQRTAQVGLFNRTANEGSYEINITEMAMTPEGQLVPLDQVANPELAARVKSAKDMIRWSPKRLTLLGRESQTIRLMARPTSDTPPGEYRAHFVAISRPSEGTGGVSIDEALTGQRSSGIGVTIRPRFGISIPVIVRVGQTTLKMAINGAQLVSRRDGTHALKIELAREGTRSAYGDLMVYREGSSDPVAIARGVGVYPEIDSRLLILPITIDENSAPLTVGERLRVVFIDDDFEPGAKLAEAHVIVP